MKVSDLMNRIRLHEIVLPEFQREYVWDVAQAQQLLESLYHSYPTGSLLFWETTTPPATKSAADAPSYVGQQQIILDGQQRLTALYLLTQDEPPPYYGAHEIKHDPRVLHFDLTTGAFQVVPANKACPPAWVATSECFRNQADGQPDIVAIARAVTSMQQGPAVTDLIQQYANKLSRVRGILDYDYPVQTVPVSATLDAAIDVFDRVNSSGTKLTPAELALTHISGKWPEARQTMNVLLQQLAQQHFRFDLDFLVGGLAGVVSGQAHFAELHYLPAATIQAGWQQLATALNSVIDTLRTHAAITSDQHLSSVDVLIPLVVYVARQGGSFPVEQARRRAIYWLYAANMWGRYTGERDQRLAYDLSLIRGHDEPWNELVGAIIAQRGRIDVRASDLEGRGPEHPLYRMALTTMAAQGATDWATGVALASLPQVHSHPLFPLPAQPDAAGEYLRRKQADEIANQIFLLSEPPAPLLPKLARQPSTTLEQHCIPADASLWQAQHFDAFLSARREHIAAAINSRLQAFSAALGSGKPFRSIAEMIAAGESIGMEFKSSLRWDVENNQKNMELEQEVAKTIAAFLNAEGGILVIGVQDNGNIYGIENDLALVYNKNVDGFELALRELVRSRMGPEYNMYVRTHFTQVDDKTVCVARVYRSPRPVFCTPPPPKQKGQAAPEVALTFFVRAGNLSQSMTPAQTNSYIALHWRT